jgi:hypothetical protein
MNHNSYYILLGKKAGGAGAVSTTQECATSLPLKYSQFADGFYWGAATAQAAWDNLIFGQGIVSVFPKIGAQTNLTLVSSTNSTMGTVLFADTAGGAQINLKPGDWFRIGSQVFQYSDGMGNINPNTPYGVSGLTSFGTQPTVFYISGPEPVECLSLGGPFTGVVVGDQENWQNVTQIWEDDGVTPFVGGNNWYAVDPELNTSMGTTLKINNCGQVVGFYAC